MKVENISLNNFYINESLLEFVPQEVALHYNVFPLDFDNDQLRLAVANPSDREMLNDLQFILGRKIIPVAYPGEVILEAIKKYYKTDDSYTNIIQDNKRSIEKGGRQVYNVQSRNGAVEEEKLRKDVDEISIIQLVNNIISDAINKGASDIHIEPYEEKLRVRFRIDGILHEVMDLPPEKKYAIISRLKIMADLDIAEKRRPQDGRIRMAEKEKMIDIRVSVIPTNFGEKVVLRILDKTALNLDLDQLGFQTKEKEQFMAAIKAPYGMILVTGPTGSGKTTTLYAALNYLNSPERNILTIEDPIEYDLPGINQSLMRSDIGYTFAQALRAFLRQDPNVIMVGEIRDLETAEIAIRAALTGHLVLSTLHTNDAPTAISRLIDMGLEPFLISSSVRMVIAQRLVRKICPDCKKEICQGGFGIGDWELKYDFKNVVLTSDDKKINSDKIKTYHGAGCDKCNHTGYKGRTALFEVMPISQAISEMILRKATAYEIKQQAIKEGMSTLRQSGIDKIQLGLTTIDEVFRETTI